jgi:hypothetical protein
VIFEIEAISKLSSGSTIDCDQRILSTGDTTGFIYSPNYPNFGRINARCSYVFEGLDDSSINNNHYENVKLEFVTHVESKAPDIANNK